VIDDETAAAHRSVRLPPGLTISRLGTPRAPRALVGTSLREANLRAAHRLTVVAIRHAGEQTDQFPDPDQPLAKGDVLVVVGAPDDVRRLGDL
jgi:trk system potassium uptake protein TrkA